MKYNWPKFKLCRREWINLFWPIKYDVRKRRWIPWQHWENAQRLTDFWKMLRNKQVLKRMYFMNEKQFKKLVTKISLNYSKNKWINHDKVLMQFLERRIDNVMVKVWIASTIMQARQMIVHWHFLLNWKKHNVPSYFVNINDEIKLIDKYKKSNLYLWIDIAKLNNKLNRLTVEWKEFSIKVKDMPNVEALECPVDILKVIEYYARA